MHTDRTDNTRPAQPDTTTTTGPTPAVLAELIVGMVSRHAESRAMACLHTGDDREWALDASRRQYEAIRRLVAALEGLAAQAVTR